LPDLLFKNMVETKEEAEKAPKSGFLNANIFSELIFYWLNPLISVLLVF